MATTSKATGVHYALVFFVLATIICGLGWLLAYKGSGSISELTAARDKEHKAAIDAKSAWETKSNELERLKALAGTKYEEMGDGTNPNTVAGRIAQLNRNYAAGLASPTLDDLITKLGEALRNTTTARDDLQEKLKTEQTLFDQRMSEMQAQLTAEKQAREGADKGKVDADNTHKEEMARKDGDISELKKAINSTQQEFDNYRDAAEKLKKELDSRINNLLVTNGKLTRELDDVKRISFEVADAEVRWIDPVAKKVWISLGEADNLKPQVTFSVYRKAHGGVGRGAQKGSVGADDIKGSIEVTRIMGPHMAEARILSEDIYNPMAKGDPVYSPLFTAGGEAAFSFVGIMDLDGDGRSDRELLHEVVANNRAVIDNEVDDQGVLWVNGKIPEDPKVRITEKTKFLVIGKIPEISEAAEKEQVDIIQKISGLRKQLEEAARERGVRVVSLADFLVYAGFKNQKRLFVPGGDVPYKLKAGSRSAATNETIGNRSSSGQTSASVSGDKMLKPKTSGGTTSKLFRANAGN